MKNHIKLIEKIGEHEGMELWTANVHHDGNITTGYALSGQDDTDWYDSDPRDMDESGLANGWRLPAYMPGFKPEDND
jgi:hypothetical protein